MINLWITAIVLVVAGYLYRTSTRRKGNLPPGPWGWPVLGNILQFSTYPWETYEKWANQYGPVYMIHFTTRPIVMLSDAKLIMECFNDNRYQIRPTEFLQTEISNGPYGIVLSSGKPWLEQRRFTLSHLRDFGFRKERMESFILDEVKELIETLKSESHAPVEMHEKFGIPVINALWMLVAGERFEQDDNEKLRLVQDMDRTLTTISLPMFLYAFAPWVLRLAPKLTGFSDVKDVSNRLRTMLLNCIQEHESTLPKDGVPRDLIDSFLYEIRNTQDPNSSFYKEKGYQHLIAMIADLFFAGTETTSTSLSWALLFLSINQDKQEKLYNEINRVAGGTRQITLADKTSMPYTQATVLETLRIRTVGAQGLTHMAEEDTTFHGYFIPKEAWIQANLHMVHHDPKIWGDPENFRPERFLSPDGSTVVRNPNLMPFSVGKRACLGESLAKDEMFLFITNIFQRFQIQLDANHPTPNMKGIPGAIIRPDEFFVMLKER